MTWINKEGCGGDSDSVEIVIEPNLKTRVVPIIEGKAGIALVTPD